ncbi:hypothetical protein CC86DRAFT_405077 [Ophiobolus disseminans]|uniref:Uncharacterized protein n=1 Tax=Ophiobolus disseminans TaxID=1469910 RepID=A0A6A7A4I2_9PLEO|nr:hypothetical protein CC86DRAFT_405077 [Ophiobolus disseminans]
MSDNTPKTADTRSPIMNDSTPSIPVSPVDTTTSDSTTSTTVSQNSTITNEKVSSTTILPPSEANETLDAEVKKVDSDNKKEGTSGPEEIPVPTTMIDKVALIIEPAAKEGHETPHSGVNESDIEETQEITNTSEEKLVPKPIPENAALIVEPAAKISDKFLDPKVYEINIDDTQESTNRAVKTPSASIKEKKVTFTEAPSNIAKERIDSHVEASHVSEPLDFEAHENDVIERQQKKRQPGKSHVCNPITQERSPQSRTASSDTCDSEATYVADVTEQEAEQYYKPPFSPPKADNIATNVNSEMNKSRSNNVEQLKVPEGRASDTGKALGLITFVDELKRSTWETDRELKSEIEGETC